MPTIVFHGNADSTVNVSNGAEIVRQAVVREQALHGPLHVLVERRESGGGRECTVTVYQQPGGRPVIEYWVVHGAGHAWSGGSPQGSFTDGSGPNASAEMVRFFLAVGRAAP